MLLGLQRDAGIGAIVGTATSLAVKALAGVALNAGLIATMAAEAAKQWTGTFNPRPVTVSEFEELYTCAW